MGAQSGGAQSATLRDVTGVGKGHCLIAQVRCQSHRTWELRLSPGPVLGTVQTAQQPPLGTCARGSIAPRAALPVRDARFLPATAQSTGNLTRHRRGSASVQGMMHRGQALHESGAPEPPILSSARVQAPGGVPSPGRRAAREAARQAPGPALRVPFAEKPLDHRRAKEPAPAPHCLHREDARVGEACLTHRLQSGQQRAHPGHRQ